MLLTAEEKYASPALHVGSVTVGRGNGASRVIPPSRPFPYLSSPHAARTGYSKEQLARDIAERDGRRTPSTTRLLLGRLLPATKGWAVDHHDEIAPVTSLLFRPRLFTARAVNGSP